MSRRSAAQSAGAGVLLLALTACGSTAPVRGVVQEKEHEPAVWKWVNKPQYRSECVTKNKVTTCRNVQTGTVPVRELVKEECFEVELEDGWDGCIPRQAWDDLKTGDTYDSSKN